MSENYLLRIMAGSYLIVYNLAEKLRFIGILAYPKIANTIIKVNTTMKMLFFNR